MCYGCSTVGEVENNNIHNIVNVRKYLCTIRHNDLSVCQAACTMNVCIMYLIQDSLKSELPGHFVFVPTNYFTPEFMTPLSLCIFSGFYSSSVDNSVQDHNL